MNAHYNNCNAALQINQPEEFEKLSEENKNILIKWIKTHIQPRKSVNNRNSSYGLKHIFEDDKGHGGFYVTNGMFKGAMRECGYVPEDERAVNWYYRISSKSLCFIEQRR